MQLISTFGFLEILRFCSVIEIYMKMSEISNFWLSVLILQVAPYLHVHTCLHILSVWCFRHKMHNAFTCPLYKMAGPRHVAQLADPSIGLALQVS